MNKRYVWLPTLRHPSAEKFEQWLNQESKQGNHLIRKKHLSTLYMAMEKEQGVAYRYAIDLQEDYVGEQRNKKRFCYKNTKGLIQSINQEIEKNENEGTTIIYIKHIFPENFFFTKVMKLTNPEFVKEQGVDRVLICGIDEGGCVSATAWEANKLGFKVEVVSECVDTVFKRRTMNYRKKLQRAGVHYR